MAEDIVAVDVGGTFTDICVLRRDTGELRVAKVPSTANPIDGVMSGVETAGIDLSQVALFSHGTTVATNALITRTYPAAAMVTTKGFRDVIEIRRGTKEDLWDAYKDVPPPPIRRRHRFEVAERVDYAGNVLEPLDEEGAREVARLLKRHSVKAVAVCFINSYANPANEQRMRDILEEELDGTNVTTSSDVLPEIFEHERFSTTIANAVLQPLVGRYVRELESELRSGGYEGDLVILHSGGGVMTPETADRWAVRLAASGNRGGRDREPPHRPAMRVREHDRVRHGRDQHGHLAGLRGRGQDHDRVVGAVRVSDPLPEHRGADHRRRRRLTGLDRRRRVAPQRAAVRGCRPRSRLLRPGWNRAHQHGREPGPRPARRRAHRRRHDPRPGQGRGGAAHAARRAARAGGDRRGARP